MGKLHNRLRLASVRDKQAQDYITRGVKAQEELQVLLASWEGSLSTLDDFSKRGQAWDLLRADTRIFFRRLARAVQASEKLEAEGYGLELIQDVEILTGYAREAWESLPQAPSYPLPAPEWLAKWPERSWHRQEEVLTLKSTLGEPPVGGLLPELLGACLREGAPLRVVLCKQVLALPPEDPGAVDQER